MHCSCGPEWDFFRSQIWNYPFYLSMPTPQAHNYKAFVYITDFTKCLGKEAVYVMDGQTTQN